MKWIELSVSVDAEAVDPIAALFQEHGHGGVAIEEEIAPFSDREGYVVVHDRPVTVRTYLPADAPTTATARAAIERGVYFIGRLRPIGPLQVREIDEQDWAEAWKEHFHVIRIGRRFVIRPSWREHAPAPDDLVIDLDPGMAFGTGLHPTTRMCLSALEDLVRPGMRVLDLGTGSGILAIGALRLGAASVCALDVDPVAVSAARANVERNGLAERIVVAEGTLGGGPVEPVGQVGPVGPVGRIGHLLPCEGQEGERAAGQTFDLVVANIVAKVIVELAVPLRAVTRSGGVLLASGIIDERIDEVQAALRQAGFGHQQMLADGDWRSVVAR